MMQQREQREIKADNKKTTKIAKETYEQLPIEDKPP